MAENPQNIIRSWNVQTNFAGGPVTVNKLVPPPYGRIQWNYVQTWREVSAGLGDLDWGSKYFSFYLPKAVRILGAMYLRIQLPELPSGTYKPYPALYAIKEIRLLSGGKEVYTAPYTLFLADHMQSLTEHCAKEFGKTYLGYEATPSLDARDIMCPILLPNSAYMDRAGPSTRGHGIFPAVMENNRLEIQLVMNDANFLTSATAIDVPTVKGKCSYMFHEVQTSSDKQAILQDKRGLYSIVNRRFTELTSGWTAYSVADSVATWNINQPQGIVTETMLIAVAEDAAEDRHTVTYIKPTSFKVIADSIVQKDLNTQNKIDAELWTNGFCPPPDFPNCGRLCFAAHVASTPHTYSGGYNQQLASNIQYEFSFNQAVRYKIVAVQLQRVEIDASGQMTASLE